MIFTAQKIALSCTILFCNVVFPHQAADAFSSISSKAPFFPSPLEREQVAELVKPIAFRIRTTVESDVQEISNVWARCLTDPSDDLELNPSIFSFRRRMNFLKSKHGVQNLLFSRLKAMQTGDKAMKDFSLLIEKSSMSDSERLLCLWSSERFRTSIERAAKLSNEPHAWKQYNFACTPESQEYLQHKMLTAEDIYSGELLGFCEIAMLRNPGEASDCDRKDKGIRPTLVNLVVNPNFRRRGVASRIIRSAQNYVTREWFAETLNLYVDLDNYAAMTLYRRLGFRKTAKARHFERDTLQLYMSLPLVPEGCSRRSEHASVHS
jgi:ribosomal protein S18 acetylase RimI-like enzyme